MASNDDALAQTAVALNEESKVGRRRKPAAKPEPAADGRTSFTLKDQDETDFRTAMEIDDTETAEGESAIERFWRRMAAAHGFDTATLVLTTIPDTGPVEFTAVATTPGQNAPAATDEDDQEGVDAEAAQSRGLQLMEQAATDLDLASETLVGDLTAGLMNIVQNLQKPWSAHSQHEKRDLVAKVEHIAKIVARQAVDVVAADDRITVKAILEKITIGDKVVIGLKLGAMPEDEQAEAIANLFHAQKKSVLIVTADADRHMGRRRELVEPDEEELPFDAGTDRRPEPQPGPEGDTDLNPDDDEDETEQPSE